MKWFVFKAYAIKCVRENKRVTAKRPTLTLCDFKAHHKSPLLDIHKFYLTTWNTDKAESTIVVFCYKFWARLTKFLTNNMKIEVITNSKGKIIKKLNLITQFKYHQIRRELSLYNSLYGWSPIWLDSILPNNKICKAGDKASQRGLSLGIIPLP